MTNASTSPAPARPSPGSGGFHVVGLDGLRAVAVLTVIAFHLFPGTAAGGYLGVDIFFVVSGYLITALLLRERATTDRTDLVHFWRRRARRLLPALGVLLTVCTAVALAVGGDALLRIGHQLVGAATFSSNWLLLNVGSGYFAESTPELFRNLWSLAVEEQFYLVWPLLFLLLIRTPRWNRVLVLAVIALASAAAMAILWDPASPTRVYYGTDTHAFGLALGAILAILTRTWSPRRLEWPRRRPHLLVLAGALSLAGLLVLSVIMTPESPLVFRGGLVLVSILTAIVIAALLVPDAWLGRVLEARLPVWIGRRSYGLYLWHWPVFILLVSALPTWPRVGVGAWVLGAAALGLTVVAAALSYRYVEEPIRRDGYRRTFRRWFGMRPGVPVLRRIGAIGLAVALVAGGSTATTFAVQADPGMGEAEAAIRAGSDTLGDGPTPTGSPTAEPPEGDTEDQDQEPAAAEPEPVSGDQITAIGDSVMLAATPELTAAFPGIKIDAAVSRGMWQAPQILRAQRDAGTLRPVVVIALGTNGPIDAAHLEEARAIVGPDRQLVVVNAQAPRGWIPGVNDALSDFAQAYREVELSNWHGAIQPHLDVLARDQVHFGGAGARIFTRALTDALQRLAELPPLRDDRADLALPRPS